MSSAVAAEHVRQQLDRIVSSRAFASSERSARLLRFVVEETLQGNTAELKEYTLGSKGLERGDDFDPRIDPIVRAEASRLRTRLALYYGDEGRKDPVEISLPKGAYVPVFEARLMEQTAPPRSRLAGWGAVGAISVIAAIAIAAWSLRARPEPQPLVRVEMELRTSDSLGSTVGPDIALSPDGRVLAFVAQDADGVAHLYTQRLDQGTAVMLEGTRGARGQFFSPNGDWIAFHAEGKLRKIPTTGGSPEALCDAGDLLGGTWAADGGIYAVLSSRGELMRIPPGGGEPALIAKGNLLRWPQLLPGDEAIVLTASAGGDNQKNIDVVGLKDGQRKTVVRGGTFGRYISDPRPGFAGKGFLTYVSGGVWYGVRFDPGRLEATGSAFPIVADMSYSPTFGYAHLAISDAGAVVYRRSSSLLQIEWLDAAGETEPLLARPARYITPKLSPDGRQLAYSTEEASGFDSWIYDLEQKTTSKLTSGEGFFGMPVWSPDGQFVFFVSINGIAWQRAAGGEPARLFQTKALQTPISFTPDGKRLAFMEFSQANGPDIMTAPIEVHEDGPHAGKPEPFEATPGLEGQPKFSPDGRWIAYTSTASGSWEVYVEPFPRNGTPRVQISVGGGRIAYWSKTRKELFYSTERQRIMVVPYSIRNGSFIASEPSAWTDRRFADTGVLSALDLASDGRRFVALMPADPPGERQSPNHVTLLLNVFDEIERAAAK